MPWQRKYVTWEVVLENIRNIGRNLRFENGLAT